MKKGLLMLLMGLIALGTSVKVYADARTDEMGTDVREVQDLDLIWLYPNMVTQYKNTVDFRLNEGPNYPGDGNFGDGTGEWGGVIAEETALGGVLGVYVNRPSYFYNGSAYTDIYSSILARDPLRNIWGTIGNANSGWDFGKNLDAYENTNIVDIFWGQGIGGADLGVHVNYGDNGVNNQTNQNASGSLALGLGFTGAGPFDELNIHADYDMESITSLELTTKNHDNGIYDVKLGALGQSNVSTDSFIRTFLDATIDQEDLKDLQQFGITDSTLVLGTSFSHKVNGGKGLVLTGLEFDWVGAQGTQYNNSPTPNQVENEDSWNLIWNGSVESELASWLTARFGISAPIVARDYSSNIEPGGHGDPDAGISYYSGVHNSVSFTGGFGINWQNFTLDTVIDIASLESSIANVQPGNGLLFSNTLHNDGNILTVTEADLRYKF